MEENTQVEQTAEVAPNPTEDSARAQGWVPKEEFQGDEHKWVDAGEFLRRGELFSKIDSQNRELKELRKTVHDFKDHYNQMSEVAYKKALSELRAEKKAALTEGDVDKVMEVEEQIEELKEANKPAPVQQTSSQEAHPEFVAWTTRNNWYVNDTKMRAYADAHGRELASKGMTPSDVLKAVEAEVKKEFQHKFQNPNRNRPSGVEDSSGKGSGTTGKSVESTMSDQDRNIMNRLVRSGAISKEQYLKDYKQMKESS